MRQSTSTNCGCWKPKRCTSSARSSPNWSGRSCCFPRARTPSSYFAWRRRLFGPLPLPFPVMHVDTGHNFPEVIEFRDRRVTGDGHKLIVASVQESIDNGPGARPRPQRVAQPGADPHAARRPGGRGFDAAFGGARRDEERARAKERILSFRDEFGQWDPRAQRPEPWSLYNGRIKKGEQVRVFPLSNWTELDVWRYIELENLEIPSIYYAHEREVFERDGILLAVSEYTEPQNGESVRSGVGALPHRRRPDHHRRGAVQGHRHRGRHRARSPRRRCPSAVRPAPTTAPRSPRWKTESERATSDERQRRRTKGPELMSVSEEERKGLS